MSLKDWSLRTGLVAGATIGIGAAVVAPAVFRIARPGIKSALKAGFAGMTAAQAAVLRAAEHVEDLLAEVAHELAQEEQSTAASAAAAAAAATSVVREGGAAVVRQTEAEQPPASAANA